MQVVNVNFSSCFSLDSVWWLIDVTLVYGIDIVSAYNSPIVVA